MWMKEAILMYNNTVRASLTKYWGYKVVKIQVNRCGEGYLFIFKFNIQLMFIY